MTKKLSELKIGEHGSVISTSGSDSYTESRLSALGLTKGSRVTKTMESPLGDPSAYLIKGSIFALRNSDAARILVTTEAHDEG